jgi:hypothetical protein
MISDDWLLAAAGLLGGLSALLLCLCLPAAVCLLLGPCSHFPADESAEFSH